MIEKMIEYQNQAEINFEKTKNFSTISNHTFAFILFIASTLFASLIFPLRYFYKKKVKNNQDSAILDLDDKNFDSTLKKEKLIPKDFWAEWCGPCIMMSSILEKFTSETKDIKVTKENAAINKKIIEKYQIKGLPQFILVKNGKEIKRFAGAMTQAALIKFCDYKSE
jgi:thioredoxin